MHVRVTLLLLLFALGLPTRSSRADTLVASAIQDTTLFQNNANHSNGQGTAMYVGKTGDSSEFSLRRGLIEFDLSAIPVGSTITGVTLTLTMTLAGSGSTTADPISVHQVLADWGEAPPPGSISPLPGGVGVQAATNDATWTSRFFNTAQVWTNPGGDFDPVASVTRNVNKVANDSILTVNWVGAGLQGDVQEWVNNPGSNFGWILLGDESKDEAARRFATAEESIVARRPKLTVLYTIPEPQTAALIFAAAGLLFSRRRPIARGSF